MLKQQQYIIRGMQRDASPSKFNKEFAYENRNIRITCNDDNTLLSCTNEKGHLPLTLLNKTHGWTTQQHYLPGKCIGQNVLNNYLTLFTKEYNTDRIYRLHMENDIMYYYFLFEGNLGFDENYPIETVGVYESKDIQKVYFVDGKNQARMINISNSAIQKNNTIRENNPKGSMLNFVPFLELNEQIKVEKVYGSGHFQSGTIQYAFSYYNLYGQESNIFHVTPIYYITHPERGASPDEICNCVFKIDIKNPDRRFDFLNIYSIHRATYNGQPVVKNVGQISVKNAVNTFYDTGKTGMLVDPTYLLYAGGEELIPSTFAHKDGTLFMGNIHLKRKFIDSNVKKQLKSYLNEISYNTQNELHYVYNKYEVLKQSNTNSSLFSLNLNSRQIKHFKYQEAVRLGLQFQHKSGKWSDVVHIGDYIIKAPIKTNYEKIDIQIPEIKYNKYTNTQWLKDNDYVKVRAVASFPEEQSRLVFTQGVLNPTIFNTQDRYLNTCFSQSSPFFRPFPSFKEFDFKKIKRFNLNLTNLDSIEGYIGKVDGSAKNRKSVHGFYSESDDDFRNSLLELNSFGHFHLGNNEIISLNFETNISEGCNYNNYTQNLATYGSHIQFRHNGELYPNYKRGCEIQNMYNKHIYEHHVFDIKNTNFDNDYFEDAGRRFIVQTSENCYLYDVKNKRKELIDEFIQKRSHNYYVDSSIITMNSPEIDFNNNYKSGTFEDLNLRIVGYVPLTSNNSDSYIDLKGTPMNVQNTGLLPFNVNSENINMMGWKMKAVSLEYQDRLFNIGTNYVGSSRRRFVEIYHWNNLLTKRWIDDNGTAKPFRRRNIRFASGDDYLKREAVPIPKQAFDFNPIFFTYNSNSPYYGNAIYRQRSPLTGSKIILFNRESGIYTLTDVLFPSDDFGTVVNYINSQAFSNAISVPNSNWIEYDPNPQEGGGDGNLAAFQAQVETTVGVILLPDDDSGWNSKEENDTNKEEIDLRFMFPVYPFHSNSSLLNDMRGKGEAHSFLNSKILANARRSSNTAYFNYEYINNKGKHLCDLPVIDNQLWNDEGQVLLKLKSPNDIKNKYNWLIYKGNVDTVSVMGSDNSADYVGYGVSDVIQQIDDYVEGSTDKGDLSYILYRPLNDIAIQDNKWNLRDGYHFKAIEGRLFPIKGKYPLCISKRYLEFSTNILRSEDPHINDSSLESSFQNNIIQSQSSILETLASVRVNKRWGNNGRNGGDMYTKRSAQYCYTDGVGRTPHLNLGDGLISNILYSNKPVQIKYKSNSHMVSVLDTKEHKQFTLPSIINNTNEVSVWSDESIKFGTHLVANYPEDIENSTTNFFTFWDDKYKGIDKKYINVSQAINGISELADPSLGYSITDVKNNFNGEEWEFDHIRTIGYGYLWMGEYYRNPPHKLSNLFGGDSEEALANNKWYVAGDSENIKDGLIECTFKEGDTYYQRYDCLKTVPQSEDDQNKIVEILSFMVETRVNIDGRYDKNKHSVKNTIVRNTNFNLMNSAYNQQDNFFPVFYHNSNLYDTSYFPSQLIISKTKNPSELIDTWCNITSANTLDLLGNKGDIKAIRKFGDTILAFQDRAIAHILFNERVQIPVSDGVPVEISNGGKLQGYRYISDKIGTSNKWSIKDTPKGIYFMDNMNKSLCRYTNTIENLSEIKGFESYMNSLYKGNHRHNKSWIPFNGQPNTFITFYDSILGDIYFQKEDESLCFNEQMDNFMTFFDYKEVAWMGNISDNLIAIKNFEDRVQLYNCHKDNYCSFFKEWNYDTNTYIEDNHDFSVCILANPDMPYDKVFDTLEWRADSFNEQNELINNETFNTIIVENEYQKAESILEYKPYGKSNLQKKFRVWGATIPRKNYMERIRNTWAYITLKHKYTLGYPNKKIELHDIILSYTV